MKILSVVAALLLFLAIPKPTQASSLVTINLDGNIVFNVLGSEDVGIEELNKPTEFEVNKIANTVKTGDPEIRIEKDSEGIVMAVSNNGSTSEMKVTGDQELVEIEAQKTPDVVKIVSSDGQFKIIQDGFTAVTDYPINIDSKRRELSVNTQSGSRFLVIYPADAVEAILKSNLINRISTTEPLVIEESEDGDVTYLIKGRKLVNLFNVYNYQLPVETRVSASTGEILVIENPSWLRVFNFLFV